MKLHSFSVTNFRSIMRAHKININDMTILVGKNNEGKSNLLKALVLSMKIIKNSRFLTRTPFREKSFSSDRIISDYIWERDFPVSIQNKKIGKETIFRLEFELNEKEKQEFNNLISTRISTNIIPIEIKIGDNNLPKIVVPKKGTSSLTKKKEEVSDFIAKKIVFNYIPAIRTEHYALDIIRNILSQELKHLEEKEEYINAVNTINRLQEEPLAVIAKKVSESLKTFLPSIRDVQIQIEEDSRMSSLRRDIDVLINDGDLTKIEYKGDGVKSLASLAMLKERYSVDCASIIAIDEPESHLHPEAINQLNQILNGLVGENQIIISTHNPLFVNKNEIKSNIIVSSGKANPAKNIVEIRNILGVKLSDNLMSYNYALIVEGETDKVILEKYLKKKSLKIKKSFDNSELTTIVLGGVNNLRAELYRSRSIILNYHVFLDKDEAAIKEFEKLCDEGLLTTKMSTFSNCNGMTESEIEDCFLSTIYADKIKDKYGVDLNCGEFKNSSKWSERMKKAFLANSKVWTEKLEKEIKRDVSNWIADHIEVFPDKSLCPHKGTSFNNLISSLENMIE